MKKVRRQDVKPANVLLRQASVRRRFSPYFNSILHRLTARSELHLCVERHSCDRTPFSCQLESDKVGRGSGLCVPCFCNSSCSGGVGVGGQEKTEKSFFQKTEPVLSVLSRSKSEPVIRVNPLRSHGSSSGRHIIHWHITDTSLTHHCWSRGAWGDYSISSDLWRHLGQSSGQKSYSYNHFNSKYKSALEPTWRWKKKRHRPPYAPRI